MQKGKLEMKKIKEKRCSAIKSSKASAKKRENISNAQITKGKI